MRYLISENEPFEGRSYRFVYDTKYKRFVVVESHSGKAWSPVKHAGENFYVYFPGFARSVRESDSLPRWAS